MPIGTGRQTGLNFRAGYLRSALGAVDRRRDFQRLIDALLNCEQAKIDLVRLRELISIGTGEVPLECRQTVWALLLDVLPSIRHLWPFVTTQLNNRYLELCQASDFLLEKQATCIYSKDRICRALIIANQLERVYNLIPIYIGIIKIFSSVFPDAEAFAFFMYSSYIRSVHQDFASIPDNVFKLCKTIDIGLHKALGRRKEELFVVLHQWIDSSFTSANLLGSLLPIWERIVLLQSTPFMASVCLALLFCAREAIVQAHSSVSFSSTVEIAVRDRPVEIIYSKALELDAAVSRKFLRNSRSRIEAKSVS